ncbi:MAG: ATPase [Treponema sp. GWA1_62_8]|nr:MAG: ATPase [Treponema sp. GWA1_62_8]
MKLSEIREIAQSQRKRLEGSDLGLPRESLATLPDIVSHALIVSGIRRCGKSTILHQFTKRIGKPYFYFNFDDLRLSAFSVPDFGLLDAIIAESGDSFIFFDEIQSTPNWELYVRQKLDERFQIIITGSNSSLLGGELGTKLTGRHITKELYPFSYSEFLDFSKASRSLQTLEKYLESGGFPEYLKTGNEDILVQLQQDILYRDVAVRYGIRDIASLKRLLTYLISNAGHLVSPSKLTGTIGVKSPSTVLEYFSHLETSYLIHQVPRFAWSAKAQSLAPKKVYIVDPGLARTGSLSFSPDTGSRLENFVFLEYRRRTDDIYYFGEGDRECDFIVNPHGGKPQCVQVCWTLTKDNEEREIAGLVSALDFFGLSEGFIITADTSDTILINGKTIRVVPAHKDSAPNHWQASATVRT